MVREVRDPFFRGIPTVGQFYRGVTLWLSLSKIHSCGDIYGHGNASLGIWRFRYQLFMSGVILLDFFPGDHCIF